MKILSVLFSFLRWVLGLTFSLILVFVVLIGILFSTTSIIISNRDNVKYWVKSSGLYENVKQIAVASLLNQPAENSDTGQPTASFFQTLGTQLNDPNDDLSKLVDKIATPQFLEKSFDTVIDAYYDWLEGKTDRPVYNITLVENKNDLISFLSISFTQKAKGLPACEKNFIVPAGFDPVNTTCWPQGMDYSAVNKYLVANSDRPELGTLQNSMTLSSQNIPFNPSQTKTVQTVFLIIKLLPVIFIFTVALLVSLITLSIPGFKKGYIISVAIICLLSLLWIIAASVLMISTNDLIRLLMERLGGQFSVIVPFLSIIIREVITLFAWVVILNGLILTFFSFIPVAIKKIKHKLAPVHTAAKNILPV
jgi:hypothetical protein